MSKPKFWSVLREQPPQPGSGFVPPPTVRASALAGLQLRAQLEANGSSRPGGTAVGVARAQQLVTADEVPFSTLKRMRSYFARHAVDARHPRWGIDSPGWVAWLLWGGSDGREWAEQVIDLFEEQTGKANPADDEEERYVAFYNDVFDLPPDFDASADQLRRWLGKKKVFDQLNKLRVEYSMAPYKGRKHYLKDTDIIRNWADRLTNIRQYANNSTEGARAEVVRRVGVYDTEREWEVSVIPPTDAEIFFWGLNLYYPTFVAYDGLIVSMFPPAGGVTVVRASNRTIISGMVWRVTDSPHNRRTQPTILYDKYARYAKDVPGIPDGWGYRTKAMADAGALMDQWLEAAASSIGGKLKEYS